MNPDYRSHSVAQAAWADEADGEPDSGEPAQCREQQVSATLHGARLDKAMVGFVPEFSRSYLQQLIAGGHVEVDGKAVTLASRKVSAGQRVRVVLVPPAESRAFCAQAMALEVVFEDEDMLVVDKPAGLVVHPAAGHWSGTLLNGLLARDSAAAALPRAGIVHRLDKDTSGLMVVGKTLQAVTALVRAIAAREVHREYLAITHGVVQAGDWRIDAPVARDPRSRVRMAIVAGGKAAVTDVQAVVRGVGVSGVRCVLHTGRTHQIRVHLASRGHPLVADTLYGGAPALGLQRQALHAAKLALRHPIHGRLLSFEAPPPQDFTAAWSAMTAGV